MVDAIKRSTASKEPAAAVEPETPVMDASEDKAQEP